MKPFQSPPPRPEAVDVPLQRIADNQPDPETTTDLPSEEAS